MAEPWQQLARLRRRLGMSQQQLARGIISQAQFSLIEQGVMMPGDDVICRLAQRVGVNADAWVADWAPHRRTVAFKRTLWRSFTRDDKAALMNELLQADASAEMDVFYYQQWLNIEAGGTESVASRLPDMYLRLQRDHQYVPVHMRVFGDIRLRIVIAMIEASLGWRLHRHQAAAIWMFRAHAWMKEVPAYWR